MAEAIDLTGDGSVIKTVVRRAKDNAVAPSEDLPLVDGTFQIYIPCLLPVDSNELSIFAIC